MTHFCLSMNDLMRKNEGREKEGVFSSASRRGVGCVLEASISFHLPPYEMQHASIYVPVELPCNQSILLDGKLFGSKEEIPWKQIEHVKDW